MSDETPQAPAVVPPDQAEQLWRRWSAAAIPAQAPLEQRTALKTAFMAGVATTLDLVIRGQDQGTIVESLVGEMTTYGQMLGLSQTPTLPAGKVVRLPTRTRPRPRST